MGFLSGKRALIVGLATDRSIAWGIAQAMHREGAELAFAHIERMTDRVVPLAKQVGSDITFVMDVAGDADIEKDEILLTPRLPTIDILGHAVAFASREALTGDFLSATSQISSTCYLLRTKSFVGWAARASQPFMAGRA